ncbi:hypothetical protein [Brevibacillus laterosporus]|nr:hypothetical protein [Brevibacillus laterosporus]
MNELKQKEIDLQRIIHDSVLSVIREKVAKFVIAFKKSQKELISTIT